jgi:2-C-methyl-D-erythritol 2,4-cyclodiphosphate synthase
MYRIGYSQDIHRLIKGDGLTICGIKIACPYKFDAHSDGDIVLHAVSEAILGALALGDLGTHFPNTDPEYKNINSAYFVKHVVTLMNKRNYRVNNIDISIIIEKPQINPYIVEMIDNLSNLLMINTNQISIKAGTNEGVDQIGKSKAALATCIVLLVQE